MQELLKARKQSNKALKATPEVTATDKESDGDYVQIAELKDLLQVSEDEAKKVAQYAGQSGLVPRTALADLMSLAPDILAAEYRKDHRQEKALTLRDIQNQTTADLLKSQADQGAMLGALASQIRDNAMLNELLAGQQNSNALVHALSQLNYETMQTLAEQLGNGCSPEAIKQTVGDRGQSRQTRSNILSKQTGIDWESTLKK